MTILLFETHEQLVTFEMVKIYEYRIYLNIRWEFCPNWLREKFRGAFKSWSLLKHILYWSFHRIENCLGFILYEGASYIQVKNVSLTNEDVW